MIGPLFRRELALVGRRRRLKLLQVPAAAAFAKIPGWGLLVSAAAAAALGTRKRVLLGWPPLTYFGLVCAGNWAVPEWAGYHPTGWWHGARSYLPQPFAGPLDPRGFPLPFLRAAMRTDAVAAFAALAAGALALRLTRAEIERPDQ